jgi:hypothetical protein
MLVKGAGVLGYQLESFFLYCFFFLLVRLDQGREVSCVYFFNFILIDKPPNWEPVARSKANFFFNFFFFLGLTSVRGCKGLGWVQNLVWILFGTEVSSFYLCYFFLKKKEKN